MTDSTPSTAPTETVQWHEEQKESYKIYWSGSHREGDFVQAYAPDPMPQTDKAKIIVYLHGFALSLPQFYNDHIETLVRAGYYVIFPDFQQSTYPDPGDTEKERSHSGVWFSLLGTAIVALIQRKRAAKTAEFSDRCRSRKLSNPTSFKQLRVSLALVSIFGLIYLVYSIIDRIYGKNLLKLLSTVGLSLLNRPAEWADNAIDLSEAALNKMAETYPILTQSDPEVVVFGHSLGGLLALSWPTFLNADQTRLKPLQVFTADPAPSTELGIPSFAIWILKLFRVPFATQPLLIKNTGKNLTVPVAILHGADDKIVRPQTWVKPALFQSQPNFDYIASTAKKIYFSLSEKQKEPPLVAFHNQAVTDTTYYDNALFKNFGGVKEDPNAYNFQYIWPWLQGVIAQHVQPDQPLTQFPPETIQITETLPNKGVNWGKLILLLGGLALLLGFGVRLWQTGAL